MPRHPLELLPRDALRRAWLASAVLSAAFAAGLSWYGRALVHPGAPRGLLSFELAWDDEGLARVLSGWPPGLRRRCAAETAADYGFLAAYGLFFAASCLASGSGAPARLGAWAATAAALLDAVENSAGLLILERGAAGGWIRLMSAAAALKFGLLALVLLGLPILWWRATRPIG